MPTNYQWKHLNGRHHLGDLDIDGMVMLTWNLKKLYMRIWTIPHNRAEWRASGSTESGEFSNLMSH